MDGIFCEDAESLLQFLEVDDLSIDDTEAVQKHVRKRVLSLYKRKGLLTEEDAENLKNWKGSGGFSVNADVRIDSDDRINLGEVTRFVGKTQMPIKMLEICRRSIFFFVKILARSLVVQ